MATLPSVPQAEEQASIFSFDGKDFVRTNTTLMDKGIDRPIRQNIGRSKSCQEKADLNSKECGRIQGTRETRRRARRPLREKLRISARKNEPCHHDNQTITRRWPPKFSFSRRHRRARAGRLFHLADRSGVGSELSLAAVDFLGRSLSAAY